MFAFERRYQLGRAVRNRSSRQESCARCILPDAKLFYSSFTALLSIQRWALFLKVDSQQDVCREGEMQAQPFLATCHRVGDERWNQTPTRCARPAASRPGLQAMHATSCAASGYQRRIRSRVVQNGLRHVVPCANHCASLSALTTERGRACES